jgi:hypothetical protein
VWETNVFGVLAVYQGMLPLLRRSADGCIVNVSSGAGSLTRNADPAAVANRAIFGPCYPASKTALNALTVAMAIELEPEGIPVNAVSPGFIKTNLNSHAGTQTVAEGAREVVRVAPLGRNGPTGRFTRWENQVIPWLCRRAGPTRAWTTLRVARDERADGPEELVRPLDLDQLAGLLEHDQLGAGHGGGWPEMPSSFRRQPAWWYSRSTKNGRSWMGPTVTFRLRPASSIARFGPRYRRAGKRRRFRRTVPSTSVPVVVISGYSRFAVPNTASIPSSPPPGIGVRPS